MGMLAAGANRLRIEMPFIVHRFHLTQSMGAKKPDQLALNRVALTLAVFLTRPQADSNRRNGNAEPL
jgi:hypothetical protein